jgi:GTP-binding protein EngB required for normal cell division
MLEEQNPDLKTSIITLGETGCGKSSFCNTLFASKRFKVGHSLDSETEIVEGKYGENEYSDIFIIDTPGLNDSEGEQKDKENAEKMKEYIKKNPRIKGILMVFNFNENRLKGSIKKSIKLFYEFFPMNNFWEHVIIIFSHYDNENEERKNSLRTEFTSKLKELAVSIKNKNPNLIIPDSIPMYFCKLDIPNENTKENINKIISDFRRMRPMFKEIKESIEPDVITSNKEGNVITYTHIVNKLIEYIDFDERKMEIREKIDEFTEKDIEDQIQEDSDEKEGEITKHNHVIFKKVTHIDKNSNSEIKIDRENPLETWFETEENVHLPEESNLTIEGNEKITTFSKYDQIKITDRNNEVTYGPKVLIDTWTTKEIEEDAGTRQVGGGDCYTIETLKKKKFVDRDGNITYGEPYVVDRQTHLVHHETKTIYIDDSDDCSIF